MTQSENLEKTRALHAAFSERRLDHCLEFAAPEVEIVLQAAGQTFRGKEGMLQFMQGFSTAFPDIKLQHTNHLSEGDKVAVEFSWSGTHLGPLMTPGGAIAPTGRKVSGKVSEFLEWRRGKLVRLVNYQDLSGIVGALTS